MTASVYTYVGNSDTRDATSVLEVGQGPVALGSSGLFQSSEYATLIGRGFLLVPGPSESPISQLTVPIVAVGSAGNPNGNYRYVFTFVTAAGETAAGPETAVINLVGRQGNITQIPVGSALSGIIKRRIYRTLAGGASGTERLVAEIADNVTTTFTDNVADGALGALVPTVDTSGVIVSRLGQPTYLRTQSSLGDLLDPNQARVNISAPQDVVPTAVVAGVQNVLPGQQIRVDVSGGNATVQLPTAPLDRTRCAIKIVKISGTPGSTTATLSVGAGDAFNVIGGSTTLTFTTLFQGAIAEYYASERVWVVQTTDTPLGNALGAAKLGSDGTIGGGTGGSPMTDQLTLTALLASHAPLTIIGATSQAASYLGIQESTGVNVFRVDSTRSLMFGPTTVTLPYFLMERDNDNNPQLNTTRLIIAEQGDLGTIHLRRTGPNNNIDKTMPLGAVPNGLTTDVIAFEGRAAPTATAHGQQDLPLVATPGVLDVNSLPANVPVSGQLYATNTNADHYLVTYTGVTLGGGAGGSDRLTGVTTVVAYVNGIATLSGAGVPLNPAGGNITTINCTSLAHGITNGSKIVLQSGIHQQLFTLSAPASLHDTSVTVVPQTPNFAYPVGTTLSGPFTVTDTSWIGWADPTGNLGKWTDKPAGIQAVCVETLGYNNNGALPFGTDRWGTRISIFSTQVGGTTKTYPLRVHADTSVEWITRAAHYTGVAPITTIAAGAGVPLNPAGGNITTIPVAALPYTVPNTTKVATRSGGNTQFWTLNATGNPGDTTLTVLAQTPSFAFPAGSRVDMAMNGVQTRLNFNTLVNDNGGSPNVPVPLYNSTTSYRFTSQRDGFYLFNPRFAFNESIGERVLTWIFVNGSQAAEIDGKIAQSDTNLQFGLPYVQYLAVGDYAEIWYRHDHTTGATINTSAQFTYLQVNYLGSRDPSTSA